MQEALDSISQLDLTGAIVRRPNSHVRACGGYFDVFRGWSKLHQMPVAIRCLRVILRDDPKFAKVNFRQSLLLVNYAY